MRYRLRNRVLETPGLGELYIERDQSLREARLTGADLVIEGYPRSANTYVRLALEHSLGDPIQISSHAHSGRHLRRAVALGLPTLLLVRQPGPAAASLVQFLPGLSPTAALCAWDVYHRTAAAVRNGLVVAGFDEVTVDLPAVLRRLDARFGTAFGERRLARPGDPDLRERAQGRARRFTADVHQVVGLPSEHRRPAAELIAGWSAADRRLLGELDAYYESFVSSSGSAAA